MMDARKTLIAWNPGTDQIKVGPLIKGESLDWSFEYRCTGGAAYIWSRSAKAEVIRSWLKAEFIAIVFRDAVCPYAAYREFSKIKQFVDAVPPDMPVSPRIGPYIKSGIA